MRVDNNRTYLLSAYTDITAYAFPLYIYMVDNRDLCNKLNINLFKLAYSNNCII